MARSTTLTPEQRTLRARIAANTRWSKDANRRANAERGQRGLMARFIDQVDPDRVLPELERMRRAEAARKAHMSRLSYLSSKARGRRAA